ncbi:MAG: cyclic peptide export ABC transporter [Pirellulales bacterium]|nr:cyclic peptide export ABC transporter [Pirellulales bacterium]
MRRLFAVLFAGSRAKVLASTALGLLSGAASAGLIAVVTQALAASSRPGGGLLAAFVALALAAALARIGSQLSLLRMAQDAVLTLRLQLVERILAAPLARVERAGSARLMAALTEDVAAISDAAMGLPFLFVSATTIAGCLAFLGWLSPGVLLAVVATLGLGVVVYRRIERSGGHSMSQARQTQDALFAALRAATDGNKELKLHRERRETFLASDLHANAAQYRNQLLLGLARYVVAGTWANTLVIVLLGVLAFGWPRAQADAPSLLTSYGMTLLYLLRPLDFVLQFLPAVTRARIALEQIDALGLEFDRPEASGGAEPGRRGFARLEYHDVCYRYDAPVGEPAFTLGPLSLGLRPGRLVFVTGGNGSGKSTLAKLLTGLYAPSSGQVTLDGLPIDERRRECLRELFAAVFYDFHLFLRLVGDEPADLLNRASEWLARLRIADKVELAADSIQALGLSQGQRRRLALVMALLDERPILLFDEWAADQDPKFKAVFYEELLPELRERGKCVVAISHDDRYYHVADEILRLENGRLVADETPRGPAAQA